MISSYGNTAMDVVGEALHSANLTVQTWHMPHTLTGAYDHDFYVYWRCERCGPRVYSIGFQLSLRQSYPSQPYHSYKVLMALADLGVFPYFRLPFLSHSYLANGQRIVYFISSYSKPSCNHPVASLISLQTISSISSSLILPTTSMMTSGMVCFSCFVFAVSIRS